MAYKGTSKYIGVFKAGTKIGKWTVVDGTVILDKEAKILCRCECGTESIISAFNLVSNKSKQCKICGNSSETHSGNKNQNWKGTGHVPASYFCSIRSRIGADFSTSLKKYCSKLLEEQNFKCAISGVPISFTEKTASLDRIDSALPYSKTNIQWVHKDINVMKNAYDVKYFISMCRIISEYNMNTDVSSHKNNFIFGNSHTPGSKHCEAT